MVIRVCFPALKNTNGHELQGTGLVLVACISILLIPILRKIKINKEPLWFTLHGILVDHNIVDEHITMQNSCIFNK